MHLRILQVRFFETNNTYCISVVRKYFFPERKEEGVIFHDSIYFVYFLTQSTE